MKTLSLFETAVFDGVGKRHSSLAEFASIMRARHNAYRAQLRTAIPFNWNKK
jgi:hypothetical protein